MDPWHQINVIFPDWADAEHTALTHLAPLLRAAETTGLITSWFFVRKAPCWRIRYLPRSNTAAAQDYIHRSLKNLASMRRIDDVTEAVYEPETHAFGGSEAMACAHRLFHLDSRHLLAYLADTQHQPGNGHRRELSILLCSTLLRTAGLDWYERGDVWALVADHRALPERAPTDRLHAFQADLRRLMSVDIADLTGKGAPLAFAAAWAAAYASAGRRLAELTANGLLHRGLRAVLAHHIIFAWNRHGLASTTQAMLSHTAKTAVFGWDPTTEHQAKTERP